MTIYERAIALAEEARAARIRNRSSARLERLERFLANDEKNRWRKRGRRVTWA